MRGSLVSASFGLNLARYLPEHKQLIQKEPRMKVWDGIVAFMQMVDPQLSHIKLNAAL